jgi:hypothetical protein
MASFRLRYLLLFLTALPIPAHAMGRGLPSRFCSSNLKPNEGPLAPTAISRTDFSKSTLIEDIAVKNQGSYGCCWISSVLGNWERRVKAKFNADIRLSEQHLILASLMYRIEEGIYFGAEIRQGGLMETADWMATHIGLVPEKFCNWKLDLRKPEVAADVLAGLNTQIEQVQNELKSLQKRGATNEEAWKFAEREKLRIMKYLRKDVGNFPSSFSIDNIHYTPHSFAAELTPKEEGEWFREQMKPKEIRLRSRAEVKNKDAPKVQKNLALFKLFPETWKKLPAFHGKPLPNKMDLESLQIYRLNGRSQRESFKAVDSSLAEMKDAIDRSIADGNSVYLATAMVPSFYRNDSGVLSVAAFKGGARDVQKAKFSGGHAVLITGIYRDAEGKLLGYRIQNSWGEARGDLGYYYMDVDYFDAFTYDIVVKRRVFDPKN